MDYNNPALMASARLPANTLAIGKALELARDFVARANCGADAEARLSIIVEELVTNIVEHGFPPPESEIAIELAALGADIGLTLSDAGVFFDLRSAAAPVDIPPERGGGAGIALVLSWANVIGYAAVDGRNVLRLVIPNHV
ncbi:MAG: ATP-binding protein [Burkholderiales bacterium]